MFQLVRPPFGGDAGETLRGGQATAEKKMHSRISRIESQPKKIVGIWGLSVQTARGMAFVFKDQVGNWPEIVYTLEVQRLVFEWYFRFLSVFNRDHYSGLL